ALISDLQLLEQLQSINSNYEEEEDMPTKRKCFGEFLQAISDKAITASASLMVNVIDGVIEAVCNRLDNGYHAWLPITDLDNIEGLHKEDEILKIDILPQFRNFVAGILFNNRSRSDFDDYIRIYLKHFIMIRELLNNNAAKITGLWDNPLKETKISFE